MLHSQGLSNNPYDETNHPIPRNDTYFFNVHSNIVLPSTFKGLFAVGLPVNILKSLSSSILATWSAHPNLLHLTILTILGERFKL